MLSRSSRILRPLSTSKLVSACQLVQITSPTARPNATFRSKTSEMENDETAVGIAAEPKKDQLVEHNGQTFKTIPEGKAFILVPPSARTSLDPQSKAKGDGEGTQVQSVFYNPIQQFNRDLSVLAIKAFSEDSCQRKRKRHETQAEKKKRQKGKKRKLEEVNGEGEDATAEGGVRLPKASKAGNDLGLGDEAHVHHGAEASIEDTKNNEKNGSVDRDGGVTLTNNDGSLEIDEANGVNATGEKNSSTSDVPGGNDEKAEVQPKSEWAPRFRILDALSATGLRALRYASEIPLVTAIVANDRDRNAVKNIDINVEHNKLSTSITTSAGDAQGHMYGAAFPPPRSHGPHHISGRYDVIDLDPYGTAAPFIDAALQALEDGGLLCVTCTDSGVFASCGYSEKTFALYGGMPVKGNYSHEAGLRLILQSIATGAAKYGMAVEPLLSLSIDFYARLFVRVRKSARDAKFLSGKTMLVYNCDHGCGAWSTQFLGRHTKLPSKGKEVNWKYSIAQAPSADKFCEHCGSKMHVAGPMWGGPIHNPAFVEKVLSDLESADETVYATKQRIEGMLDTALDELLVNSDTMDYRPGPSSESDQELIPQVPPEALDHHPFFFISSALCKVIKAQAPPENLVKGALRYAGYRVTRSHCRGGSLKTDAPWSVIWEVMREWVRQKSPIKDDALKEGGAGWKIMQGMRKSEVDAEVDAAEGAAFNGDTVDKGESDNPKAEAKSKRMVVVFDEKLGKDKPGKRLVRYQMNPRENWGPMTKAKGHA